MKHPAWQGCCDLLSPLGYWNTHKICLWVCARRPVCEGSIQLEKEGKNVKHWKENQSPLHLYFSGCISQPGSSLKYLPSDVLCVRSTSFNVIILIRVGEWKDKMWLEECIHSHVTLWKTRVLQNLCFSEGLFKAQLMWTGTLLLRTKRYKSKTKFHRGLGGPPYHWLGPTQGCRSEHMDHVWIFLTAHLLLELLTPFCYSQ